MSFHLYSPWILKLRMTILLFILKGPNTLSLKPIAIAIPPIASPVMPSTPRKPFLIVVIAVQLILTDVYC